MLLTKEMRTALELICDADKRNENTWLQCLATVTTVEEEEELITYYEGHGVDSV